MSDDESRNERLPTEGDEIFTENGSETVENGQTELPPWAAAVTAQIQKVFTEQLEDHLAAQAQANRAELQGLIDECRASARTARMATAQWQDQQELNEARQERTSIEASESSPQTAELAQAAHHHHLLPSAPPCIIRRACLSHAVHAVRSQFDPALKLMETSSNLAGRLLSCCAYPENPPQINVA